MPLPATLTASQLVRLAADPDGFAAELARPLPRRPSPAARRGTAFHAWVEQRLGQRPVLDDTVLDDPELGAADPEHPDDVDVAALRAAFDRSQYADRVPVGVEVPFEVALAGRILRGRIDAVFPAPPGPAGEPRWEVVDWKTGAAPPDPLQLAVYRVAWARRQRAPLDRVDAAFVHVADGRVSRFGDLPDETALARILADAR